MKKPVIVFIFVSLHFLFTSISQANDTEIWLPIGLDKLLINDLVVDPIDSAVIYSGTNKGVYKTLNSGKYWQAVNDGLPSDSILVLSIDPKNHDTIYAGTNLNGIYKSVDRGISWNSVSSGLSGSSWVRAIAIDKLSPSVIYAGTLTGLYKSIDEGQSWVLSSDGMPQDIRVGHIVIVGGYGSKMYAGTSVGVYKSMDYGQNWVSTSTGLPPGSVVSLQVDPKSEDTLYACFGSYLTTDGVYKSVNGGTTWQLINTNMPYELNLKKLLINPNNTNILYAAYSGYTITPSGVFISFNGGGAWEPFSNGLPDFDVSALAVDPEDSAVIFAGTGAGVFKRGPIRKDPGFLRPLRVPDTDQTISYTDVYGEDSDYTISKPSYTKLDPNGNDLPEDAETWAMVRDNITGLIWEVKTTDGSIHDTGNGYFYNEVYRNFINVLNSEKFGGFNNWRIPSTQELLSIVMWDADNLKINEQYFPNTKGYGYQTCDTHPQYIGTSRESVWTVDFATGDKSTMYKSKGGLVRAVFGHKKTLIDPFVINGDNTVTDISTGLMWRRLANEPMTWENSIRFCENLVFAGYDDWRLPNFRELQSALNYADPSRIKNTRAFRDIKASLGWSSTTKPPTEYQTNHAMGMIDGTAYYHYPWDKNSLSYFPVIRGGQKYLEENLFIMSPQQGEFIALGSIKPILWDTRNIQSQVKITYSIDGGKNFETIIDSTDNDGHYDWTVVGDPSPNCMLRIFPIALGYRENGSQMGLFSITNVTPGITVESSLQYTYECGKKTYISVSLDSEPQAEVEIGVLSSNESEGIVSPDSLVFSPSNWQIKQTVEVTGVGDQVNDGDKEYSINLLPAISIDPVYSQLDPNDVDLTNIDQEQFSTGDLNADGIINLSDAIVSFQVLSGLTPNVIFPCYQTSGIDVSGDDVIGIEESLFILQFIGTMR